MSKVEMRWDTKKIETMTAKALEAGLREAAKHGRKAIKAELGGGADSPAGGPPGKVSGALRRSVGYRVKKRRGKYVLVDVGVLRPSPWDSKAPGRAFPGRMHAQAVRLASGFVGRDRKGRLYQQRPRPFVEPVLRRDKKKMATIVRDTSAKWMPKAKEKR